MFVVVGSQRSGSNILREILNSNRAVAMLGEVLMPSDAPAHWHNFLRAEAGNATVEDAGQLDALLDRYFQFVRYRIRNHWAGNLKSHSNVIGVDVKYNQLRSIAPSGWSEQQPPFLLRYFKLRGFTIVHNVRRNVVRSALSASLATQRNLWHNYEGVAVDRRYHVDVEACLAHARTIVAERAAFSAFAEGSRMVPSYYHELTVDLARRAPDGTLREGPGSLRAISRALGVPFQFHYDGRLQRAVNMPYSRVISNFGELVEALERSEFSADVATLDE